MLCTQKAVQMHPVATVCTHCLHMSQPHTAWLSARQARGSRTCGRSVPLPTRLFHGQAERERSQSSTGTWTSSPSLYPRPCCHADAPGVNTVIHGGGGHMWELREQRQHWGRWETTLGKEAKQVSPLTSRSLPFLTSEDLQIRSPG